MVETTMSKNINRQSASSPSYSYCTMYTNFNTDVSFFVVFSVHLCATESTQKHENAL
jgi:hypothetical protein